MTFPDRTDGMTMGTIWAPYCGAAPLPQDWLERWNLDPTLLLVMGILAGLHLFGLIRAGGFHRKRWCFTAGWVALAALFVSPLCGLSSALFSVRVVHHIALIALIAPLFALSLPGRWRVAALPSATLCIVFVVHAIIVWFWHAPPAYASALSSDLVFWTMQITLAGSALLLWSGVLAMAAPLGASLAVLLGSIVQMGLLGALITFAPAPLYAPHLLSTEPFGLSALADQQLAGLIMWVPAVLPYLAAALALLSRWLAHAARAGHAA
jgi:putative membrane protein